MEMSIDLWIEYIIRFAHLVAGISWIGSSFYFIWLDSAFQPTKDPRHNVDGEVFMVHGGFYYQVDKKKILPGEVPDTLHWFKWEATLTWVTGFMLLVVVYFMKGASLLIDPAVMELTQIEAICFCITFLLVSWFTYDLIYNPKLEMHKAVTTVSSLTLFVVLVYAATHIFSGQGAFIIVGAVLGSLMLLNVWVRILPGQAQMLKDAQAGKTPDFSLGGRSKIRSVHNTYFIFPVLFIMLSNHYGTVYNHEHNWILLIILSVSGACVRHAMVTKVPAQKFTLLPAAIGLLALVFMTAAQPKMMEIEEEVTYTEIKPIIQSRCISCHATVNTDDLFKVAINGVIFETEEQLLKYKDKIIQRVVIEKSMPLMNKTEMTERERAMIYKWLSAQ